MYIYVGQGHLLQHYEEIKFSREEKQAETNMYTREYDTVYFVSW